MTVDHLRRAAAHVVVDSVAAPELDDASQHHLFGVLRLREGEHVTVTDGRGRWRGCRAVGNTIAVDGDVVVETRPSPVTIGVAIPKQDRVDWVIQKLTEIGVADIVLLAADRSVVRWEADRAAKRVDKLERIAREALQQSRQVWLPTITGPRPAADFLCGALAAEPGAARYCAQSRTIAVGPEGGWSDRELEVALGVASFGPSILRVETAAIVAAVLALQ